MLMTGSNRSDQFNLLRRMKLVVKKRKTKTKLKRERGTEGGREGGREGLM